MSRPVALRVCRRMSVLEEVDLDVVRKLLFLDPKSGELDHRPSVYAFELDAENLSGRSTQCHAEHSASFRERPPSSNEATVDLAGLGCATAAEVNDSNFAFTRQFHANCQVESTDDLSRMTARFVADRERRGVAVRHREILKYVADKLDARDEEWVSFMALPRSIAWTLAIQKWRNRPS